MEQKFLIYLLGFNVVLSDRRNGEEKSDFIVIPCPEEHPESLEDIKQIIKKQYAYIGYGVKEIEYKTSKCKEMNLIEEYNTAEEA